MVFEPMFWSSGCICASEIHTKARNSQSLLEKSVLLHVRLLELLSVLFPI